LNIVDEPTFRNRQFIFGDRLHAGQLLAEKLRPYALAGNAYLLALPAGGVPVGFAVAEELNIPLDVVVVRKIQIPWNTEAGFGAIAWDGRVLLNEQLVAELGLDADLVERCIAQTREIVKERARRFRGAGPFPDLNSKSAIVVDDGLASGFTMLAAVESIRAQRPKKIVVAVPTGSPRAIDLLAPTVDELVCLNIRGGPIFAVADAYQRWYDLSDDEALEFLRRSWSKGRSG